MDWIKLNGLVFIQDNNLSIVQNNPVYHSMQIFLPIHWPKSHQVTAYK